MTTVGSPALWIGFLAFVLVMLALDLGVFNRRAHAVSFKEAALWSGFWIGLSLLFNLLVYHWFGGERALEFLTAYIIEKSLSIDNVFVFVVVFTAFGIPAMYQHRVLFWGVLGALVMRAAFILAGTALIQRFHWVMYVFGALLVVTAVKMLLVKEAESHPERNPLVSAIGRLMPVEHRIEGSAFVVRRGGRWAATPLLPALVTIEMSDVVFAVDSIPAIFAVTLDPFIVFTSNIFAILGLRSLYFLLAGVMDKFRYLKVGLALVLGFVGTKMLIADVFKVPILVSLTVIAVLIGGAVLLSWLLPEKRQAVRV